MVVEITSNACGESRLALLCTTAYDVEEDATVFIRKKKTTKLIIIAGKPVVIT